MIGKKLLGIGVGLMVLAGGIWSGHAEASNLDTYRDLLTKKTYTIRYIDVTPEARVTNKDKVTMYNRSTMDTSKSYFLQNQQVEYLITADGDNKYEEMGAVGYRQCRLVVGDQTYVFMRNAASEVYANSDKGITAIKKNKRAEMVAGASFGGSSMTRYLNAMLPSDKKSQDMPVFKYVKTGWLSNGMNYEDYTSTNDGVFEAVRYYFDGYNLVKIAAIQCWTNADGVMEGKKTILKITEFSPTPNKEYLKVPDKVISKSKKKAEVEEEAQEEDE